MNININKVKIEVVAPTDYIEKIRNAICSHGAGVIGNYSYCTTSIRVTGTYMATNNANPYIGEKNKIEYATGERLEVRCDIKKAKEIISIIKKIHPYEEEAIDIISLINEEDLI